jgi:hypothetical protein
VREEVKEVPECLSVGVKRKKGPEFRRKLLKNPKKEEIQGELPWTISVSEHIAQLDSVTVSRGGLDFPGPGIYVNVVMR